MKIINPHVCIDNEPNYAIIMSLGNRDEKGKNFLLAMYSEKALKYTDSINKESGFVASVTNGKVFHLVKTNKTASLTEYNQYSIVFGNSELYFKIGSDVLEMNIGHAFRSIDTGLLKDSSIFTGANE
jgi:hypothetical protein